MLELGSTNVKSIESETLRELLIEGKVYAFVCPKCGHASKFAVDVWFDVVKVTDDGDDVEHLDAPGTELRCERCGFQLTMHDVRLVVWDSETLSAVVVQEDD